jgi:hypothetical protein
MYEIVETDLNAEVYKPLVNRLCEICDTFTFAVLPKQMMGKPSATLCRILADLEPYLKEIVHTNGTRANLFDSHVSVPNYEYHLCKESQEVLLRAAESIFHWQQPTLPEDLSFLKKGKEYFVTNAHEGYAMLFGEDRYLAELRGTKWNKTE